MNRTVLVYQCQTCNKAWDDKGMSDSHQTKTRHPKVVVLRMMKTDWDGFKIKYFSNMEADE